MMAKIKLAKNELKRQKDSLKRFLRYLPMLQLKKKQLQIEIIKVHREIDALSQEINELRSNIVNWVDVFAQNLPLTDFISLENIKTKDGNVAGIDLPVFLAVEFRESAPDKLLTPFWVDKGIEALKSVITLKAKLLIYHRQLDILKNELRIANQRVNLFEKVKIPGAQENIRILQIYLGEIQTAEVVRGKIAKAKVEKRKLVNA